MKYRYFDYTILIAGFNNFTPVHYTPFGNYYDERRSYF